MINYPNREEFLKAAEKQLERNIFFHSLAFEACMEGIYDYLSQVGGLVSLEPKKEEWLLAGMILMNPALLPVHGEKILINVSLKKD